MTEEKAGIESWLQRWGWEEAGCPWQHCTRARRTLYMRYACSPGMVMHIPMWSAENVVIRLGQASEKPPKKIRQPVLCESQSRRVGEGRRRQTEGRAHLGVLRGDLEEQGQRVMVEVLVQGQQGTMHAALVQASCVLPKPNRLDPVDHLVVGPDQHIWRAGKKGAERDRDWAKAPAGPEGSSPDPELQSTLLSGSQGPASSVRPTWLLGSCRTTPSASIPTACRTQGGANRLLPAPALTLEVPFLFFPPASLRLASPSRPTPPRSISK